MLTMAPGCSSPFLHLDVIAQGGEVGVLGGEGGQEHQGVGWRFAEPEPQDADAAVPTGAVYCGAQGAHAVKAVEADVSPYAVAHLVHGGDGILLLRVDDVGGPHLQRLLPPRLQGFAHHHPAGALVACHVGQQQAHRSRSHYEYALARFEAGAFDGALYNRGGLHRGCLLQAHVVGELVHPFVIQWHVLGEGAVDVHAMGLRVGMQVPQFLLTVMVFPAVVIGKAGYPVPPSPGRLPPLPPRPRCPIARAPGPGAG